MTATRTEERPIAAWMQALDEIARAVHRRLAHVESVEASPEPGSPTSTPLQILDDRLAQMQARLGRAERDADEADQVLRTEGEAYQRWTEAMAAARRGLADWAGGVDKETRRQGDKETRRQGDKEN